MLSGERESDRGLRPPRDTAKDLKHSLGGQSRAVEIRRRAEEEIRREKIEKKGGPEKKKKKKEDAEREKRNKKRK